MTATVRFQTSLDRLMAHHDRDVRVQAARCVGRLPGPAVVGRLRRLAEDDDVHVRREALGTLAERAPGASRATLRRAFDDDADLECRRAALRGLVALADAAILPAIRRLLRNPDAFRYEQAPATQASRRALCCEAVEALAVIGDPSVVPDLLALLDHHVSPQLDDAVIRALAHLGEAGRAAIGDVARAAPPHRARSAIHALAAHHEPGETDAIALFLSHEETGVRLAAATALARLAPSHSALLRRVGDSDPMIRALVAEHAGPTMPSILELLLDDPDARVVVAALAGLAAVAPDQLGADTVWRVQRLARGNEPAIAARAMETLATLAPATAVNDLAKRLADADAPTSVRLTAIRLLVAMRTPDLAPRLLPYLFSGDAELRSGVLDGLLALARRRDADAIVDCLLDVVGDRPDYAPIRLRPGPLRRGRTAIAGLAEAVATDHVTPAQEGLRLAPAEIVGKVRLEVAERLASLPLPNVASALSDVAGTDQSASLRQVAAQSLAQVVEALGDAPRNAIDVASALAADDDPALRLAGVRVLAAGLDHTHGGALVQALEDADPAVRARASRWIAEATVPLDVAVVERLERGLTDRNAAVRLAAMSALATRRGDRAAGTIIDAAILAGDETIPAIARCLGVLDPIVIQHELARRLATAASRDRQLALLRLSDAILAESTTAEAA